MAKVPVSESTKTDFLKELRALLEKYNASIYGYIDGDTQGISDEAMVIDINDTEIFRASGWELSHHNIK